MGLRWACSVQEVEGGSAPRARRPERAALTGLLDSTVGLLVWRALVLWVFVLLVVTIARLL
jgi:hypothetical protein